MLWAARFADMLAGQQFAFRGWVADLRLFREVRALREAIENLARGVIQLGAGLHSLIEVQREIGPADERLEELERTRARWEAEMEALQLKADSTFKSASNAESRTRTMVRHAEKLADPFPEDGEEEPPGVQPTDAERGQEEGLQPVRVAVAPDNKQNALRFKFS